MVLSGFVAIPFHGYHALVVTLASPYLEVALSGCLLFLPARASEQGNVNRVCPYIYIYMCVQKKIVIERTKDLNYLKFVATDFSLKTISPSAGENSGDLA